MLGEKPNLGFVGFFVVTLVMLGTTARRAKRRSLSFLLRFLSETMFLAAMADEAALSGELESEHPDIPSSHAHLCQH